MEIRQFIGESIPPPHIVRQYAGNPKRYLFRGQAAQQGFHLFFYRVVRKKSIQYIKKKYNKKIALLFSIN